MLFLDAYDSTKSIILLLKFNKGKASIGLRENNMATVLIGLKSTSHFLAHSDISERS